LEQIGSRQFFITTINLSKCVTWNGFIREMKYAFGFPDYFGYNLNALNDCMRDLSWIPEKNYKIVFKNKIVFEKRDSKQLKNILEIFALYKEYWDKQSAIQNENDCIFFIEIE